jgi:CheY-like chemotaxis protein
MPKKILLVEDDDLIRQGFKDGLSPRYDVETAVNGKEGLEKALDIKPDIVLLDIFMPVMNGLETLSKLRSDPVGKSIPVIMLTNDSDAYDEKEAVHSEANDYIIKANTSIEQLMVRIENAINNAELDQK